MANGKSDIVPSTKIIPKMNALPTVYLRKPIALLNEFVICKNLKWKQLFAEKLEVICSLLDNYGSDTFNLALKPPFTFRLVISGPPN